MNWKEDIRAHQQFWKTVLGLGPLHPKWTWFYVVYGSSVATDPLVDFHGATQFVVVRGPGSHSFTRATVVAIGRESVRMLDQDWALTRRDGLSEILPSFQDALKLRLAWATSALARLGEAVS